MSISSIQEAQRQYEIFPSQRLSTYTDESASFGNSGADTVSISPEARAMMEKTAASSNENEDGALQQATRAAAQETSKALPEIDKGRLMSMMMEMLFISEQGEQGAAQVDADGNPLPEQQAKSANPFQDSEQTANLKKVMNDFASGKGDISDIPAAMAGGKSAAAGVKQASNTKSIVTDDTELNKII